MPRIPADTNQFANRIVDLVTGEAAEEQPIRRQLGGVASASKLTTEQCHERASKAALSVGLLFDLPSI